MTTSSASDAKVDRDDEMDDKGHSADDGDTSGYSRGDAVPESDAPAWIQSFVSEEQTREFIRTFTRNTIH